MSDDGGGRNPQGELRTQKSIQRAMEMLIRHAEDSQYKKLLFNAQERIKELEHAEENR